MNWCLPYTPCLVHPIWIVTWEVGWPCVSLHVNVPFTLVVVLHLVKNVYMHQYMNLCPAGCLCVVHPLCIVWWKPGCPCMTVCLCASHLISVATPCFECVHASVHELYVYLTPHVWCTTPCKDSYMESWVALCVLHAQSHEFLHLVCVYMHQYMNLCPAGCCVVHPLCIVWWKLGYPCMAVCLIPSHAYFSFHILFSMWT